MIDDNVFKNYQLSSVKIDRYFHCVNAYANNHTGLKFINDNIDNICYKAELHPHRFDADVSGFLFGSHMAISHLRITNIFSDNYECNLGDIVKDMQSYSFVTCYCYQWSLFESIITYVTNEIIALGDEIIRKGIMEFDSLCKLKQAYKHHKTKQILDVLNKALESTPFEMLLPSFGKEKFKKVDYKDLDRIRNKRNDFIHQSLTIDLENIQLSQTQYNDDMWTLRLFAENAFFLIKKICS